MVILIDIFLNTKFTYELIIAELLFLKETEHKSNILLRGLSSILVCGIASMALNYQWVAKLLPQVYPVAGVLRFIVITAFTLGGVRFCFKCPNYQLFLSVIGGYMVQHVAYSVHELVLMLWSKRVSVSLEATHEGPFYYITFFIVYIIAYWILYRFLITKLNVQRCKIKIGVILLLSACVLINILVFSLCTYNFDILQLVLFRMLSIITCISTLSILLKLMEVHNLQRDVEFIKHMSSMKSDYYELLRDNITATNIQCHDFKHQIAQLRREEKSGRFMETVYELEKTILKYDSICKTGNAALDVVLTEKSMVCAQEQIRFTYMVDSEKLECIEERELYALFGNILDNAIEAVKKLGNREQRVVNLSVSGSGSLLNIHSYNYYENQLELEDGLPITTKEDSLSHGYGMKSIRMIVNKYDGDMQINANGNVFDLNIVFPYMN